MLTLEKLLMGRIKEDQLSPQLLKNALALIDAVNSLLKEVGIGEVVVSSGYRSPATNSAAGGAKRSLHMECLAVDLMDDKNQSLAKLISSKPDLLRKYKLFIENPSFTKGKFTNWVHLDMSNRSDRPSRMFNP